MSREVAHDTQDALIEQYREYAEKLVRGLMRHLSLPSSDFDDMLAAGYMGLVEAARRYTKSHRDGAKFVTFAYFRIRGAVIDWIRDSSSLSGRAYHLARALEASNDFAESQIAQNLEGFTEGDELANLLEATTGHLLIYRLSLNDAKDEVESIISEEDNCEDKLVRRGLHDALRHAVASLPEKERTIVEAYYYQGKSFKEIVDEGPEMSKSWVSRLHTRAIKLLRDKLLAEGGEYEAAT